MIDTLYYSNTRFRGDSPFSMPSSSTISVIVAVYNSEKTLRKCVESICASDYPYLEIICVNDGSTDGTPQILAELAQRDPRIVVINQENKGVSAARNAALDIAGGEYVTGVDADDYISPDLYGQAVRQFAPDTDVVAFGVTEEYDPPDAKPAEKMYRDEPFEGYREVTEQVILNMHNMFCIRLWRRSVIEENHIRFPLGVRYEDADFFMKAIVHCKKVCFLRNRGYHYFQHADSFMDSQFSGHASLDALMGVERRLHEYYHEKGLWEQQKSMFVHRFVCCSAGARLFFPASAHSQVQEAYYKFSRELRLQEEMPHDFPLQTLKPVTGWKKLFLTHLPNTRVYRFLGVALFFKRCENGEIQRGMFNPLKTLSRLFGRRGNSPV